MDALQEVQQEVLVRALDALFIIQGGALVLLMHAGFAFVEVGTVRRKNQANGLCRVLCDLSVSVLAYTLIGSVIFAWPFSPPAIWSSWAAPADIWPRHFFILLSIAAIPAIISGGIAERVRFVPQLLATALIMAFLFPFLDALVVHDRFGFQAQLCCWFAAPFHDYADAVVIHGFAGWAALAATLVIGPRQGRFGPKGRKDFPPSNIPFMALGTWILMVGWFGFTVLAVPAIHQINGLVVMNVVMAMAGGIVAGLIIGRGDTGFIHNGALSGLVAICAGADVMHPLAALLTGSVASVGFVLIFTRIQQRRRVDDVLGVWPLHGVNGIWGVVAAGLFGQTALGGLGGVSLYAQIVGALVGIVVGFIGGLLVYGLIHLFIGLRLSPEQEARGADLSLHRIRSSRNE
ncbi:ammonium transporter [Parendozoicomonas haliclonae]|uniref:Ammonia channel n=1 Tax=Parendozoicomonas haliclonae TaxID=1960125 RepID=A0A1X7AM04_9GAMM|nr:ammonium transporter [Parendozoicomonas haliclonae]SMA49212.1 Ammonia channel precursor [Parendozoicomonas haliclonae]